MYRSLLVTGVMLVSSVTAYSTWAQNASNGNSGWFVPKSSQPTQPAAPSQTPPSAHVQHRVHTAPIAAAPLPEPSPSATPIDNGDGQQQGVMPVLPLPVIPTPTPVAKATPPVAPLIGVISVPEIMRKSTAALQADKILGGRRAKLIAYSRQQQAALRNEEQNLRQQARKMTQVQFQASVRKLQEREVKIGQDLRNRNRIIQESAQVSFGQIQRELELIIRLIAESHNMNIVLHREQTVLSIRELDISSEVVAKLNTTLPSVFVPDENVDPEVLAKSGTMPTTEHPEGAVAKTPEVPPPPAPSGSSSKTAPAPAGSAKK